MRKSLAVACVRSANRLRERLADDPKALEEEVLDRDAYLMSLTNELADLDDQLKRISIRRSFVREQIEYTTLYANVLNQEHLDHA